jgi:hypothetical protein
MYLTVHLKTRYCPCWICIVQSRFGQLATLQKRSGPKQLENNPSTPRQLTSNFNHYEIVVCWFLKPSHRLQRHASTPADHHQRVIVIASSSLQQRPLSTSPPHNSTKRNKTKHNNGRGIPAASQAVLTAKILLTSATRPNRRRERATTQTPPYKPLLNHGRAR